MWFTVKDMGKTWQLFYLKFACQALKIYDSNDKGKMGRIIPEKSGGRLYMMMDEEKKMQFLLLNQLSVQIECIWSMNKYQILESLLSLSTWVNNKMALVFIFYLYSISKLI